jgi:hypothetical protein
VISSERPQSITSPSTAKQTESQYKFRTEIQSKGIHNCCETHGADCTAAEPRRAARNPPTAANDRNSINIDLIPVTPPLADSWEQASDHSVEQSRRVSRLSLPTPMKTRYILQTASAQVPILINPELARCSSAVPALLVLLQWLIRLGGKK